SRDIISISGDLGAYGELYSITGQPKRRPSATGRLFFRPVVDFYGVFQLPFDFLLSTEGSSARQSINQFGLNPDWGWGSAHIGDFNKEYSPLSLSGIKIRGGGLNFSPDLFRISVVSGFTQRSVPGGAQDGSYKRFLLAAKLGYGKEDQTYFDLIFLKAKDEVGSLPQNVKSVTVISPNGDDIFPLGSLTSIKWTSAGIGGLIKIEISRNGGNSYELIANDQPNIGYYNWTITGPETFEALIKITSVEDSSAYDISDYFFRIAAGVEYKQGLSVTDQILNSNAVTPQENLLLAAKGRIAFGENRFVLDYEAGGSIYTRDLRASKINQDSVDVPKIVTAFYDPYVGTNYDYAINTLLSFNISSASFKAGYKYTGPGYYSLGLAYLLNDIQEISLNGNFRVDRFSIGAGWINQSDNLIDQKAFTTSRNLFNVSVNGMLTDIWTIGAMANILGMNNDSNNDTTKTDFSNLVLGLNQNFLLSQTELLRAISLNYFFQNSNNESVLLKNNTTNVHTFNFALNLSLLSNLNSALSAGLVSSEVFDTLNTLTQTYAITFQHRGLDNQLSSSLMIGTSLSEKNTSFRTGLNSNYNISSNDALSFVVSYTVFNGTSVTGGKFNEIQSSLSYSRRF
ncbi:MAG: hypothetical protein MUE64_04660, partial [Ignavibacteriaceae bacterium]|nr:hypothetical protein [Ignavibacteriaceae bacterium]